MIVASEKGVWQVRRRCDKSEGGVVHLAGQLLLSTCRDLIAGERSDRRTGEVSQCSPHPTSSCPFFSGKTMTFTMRSLPHLLIPIWRLMMFNAQKDRSVMLGSTLTVQPYLSQLWNRLHLVYSELAEPALRSIYVTKHQSLSNQSHALGKCTHAQAGPTAVSLHHSPPTHALLT